MASTHLRNTFLTWNVGTHLGNVNNSIVQRTFARRGSSRLFRYACFKGTAFDRRDQDTNRIVVHNGVHLKVPKSVIGRGVATFRLGLSLTLSPTTALTFFGGMQTGTILVRGAVLNHSDGYGVSHELSGTVTHRLVTRLTHNVVTTQGRLNRRNRHAFAFSGLRYLTGIVPVAKGIKTIFGMRTHRTRKGPGKAFGATLGVTVSVHTKLFEHVATQRQKKHLLVKGSNHNLNRHVQRINIHCSSSSSDVTRPSVTCDSSGSSKTN